MKGIYIVEGKKKEYNSFAEWYQDFKNNVILPFLREPYFLDEKSLTIRTEKLNNIFNNIDYMTTHFGVNIIPLENIKINITVSNKSCGNCGIAAKSSCNSCDKTTFSGWIPRNN